MNKTAGMISFVLCAAMLLAGCGSVKAPEPMVYSNLSESSVRLDLDSLLQSAGIGEQNRAVLFEHADQINRIMDPETLTAGFTPIGEPRYDPYALQEAWDSHYPDFFGYNCRITAFGLVEDTLLEIPRNAEILGDDVVLFDLAALEEDPSADINTDSFRAFYSAVPTEMTKDVEVHAENWINSWKDRGIHIADRKDIRLITVIFHAEGDGESYLFAGHTGILLPTPDGNFWFLEKLAFQEPYQVVAMKDRQQLQEYLMGKYDLDQGQPVSKPFILENMELMKP